MKQLFFAAVLVGCGSSEEPQQHPTPDVGLAAVEVDAAAPAAVRTMKTVSLFGDTAVGNLLIDPTFDDAGPGVGRWLSNLGTSPTGGGPTIEQIVLSDSPASASIALGAMSDIPEKGSPRTFSLVAQVPGGTGPYIVSLWVSSDKPTEGDLTTLVRVSLANASGISISGFEIPHESERTIAGRVWHHYRGEVAGPFSMGAYMMVRLRASRTRWYLQAPEVVPSKLMASDTAKALVGKHVLLEPEERAAIAAYQRIPRVQGVPTRASKPAR